MTSKKRKHIKRVTYYTLATILFIILTPSIILWALGYRIDFKNYKVAQTGILYIKTDQSSFDIFIDGQKTFSNKKTITIKSLLPKDYSVKIEKQGYYPWSKDITIDPQKITRQDYIILFPNNLTTDKYITDINGYKITPDQSTIIAVNSEKNKLQKINLKDKSISEANIDNIEQFEPSDNGSKILVKQGPENRFIVVDLEKNGAINELSNEPENINQITWLPGNNQTLFLVYNGSLYKTNVGDNPIVFNLLKASVVNFKFANNQIFYLQTDKNEENGTNTLSLWTANFALDNPQQLIKDLPASSYQIIPSPDGQKIILKENSKGIIYRVQKQKLEKLNEDIKDVVWDSTSQKFLSHSDYEIWLSEISNNSINTDLINRYSEKIDNLLWYPDGHHLIFTLGNKIDVAEEDGTNLIELEKFQVPNQTVSLTQNRTKTTSFFLNKKEIDQQINLYNLNINNP